MKEKLDKIKMLIMDLDGVLTDGGIIINADGSESKRFSVVDGHGIKMWHRAGLKTAIISGRAAKATSLRAEQLDIGYVYQGCKEKVSTFEAILEQAHLQAEEVAYIGDDLMDLPLVRRAGFGVAVQNGVGELKEAADYVTEKPGGFGAVRELVELILKTTGRWETLMQRYLV